LARWCCCRLYSAETVSHWRRHLVAPGILVAPS